MKLRRIEIISKPKWSNKLKTKMTDCGRAAATRSGTKPFIKTMNSTKEINKAKNNHKSKSNEHFQTIFCFLLCARWLVRMECEKRGEKNTNKNKIKVSFSHFFLPLLLQLFSFFTARTTGQPIIALDRPKPLPWFSSSIINPRIVFSQRANLISVCRVGGMRAHAYHIS